MIGYIYKTTNLINGKQYIGKCVSDVFLENKYLGSGVLLKKAVKKYGIENFKVELIEECNTKLNLSDRECYWIEYYDAVNNDNFYNLSCGKEGFKYGYGNKRYFKHSEDCKRKISKSNKGKPVSLERRRKISNTLKEMYQNGSYMRKNDECYFILYKDMPRYLELGFKCVTNNQKSRQAVTEETRRKLSESHKRFYQSLTAEERKQKCGHSCNFAKTLEYKKKMSNTMKGKNTWSKGKIWVHKLTEKQCIESDKLNYYISIGYHKGMYMDKCKICSSTIIESIVKEKNLNE